jgi:hypothetical protein
LFVNDRIADLGIVKRGLIGHDFRMTNHGQRRVQIASVRTSSGSLSAVPSKNELAPGESAEIHTRLDTNSLNGSKTFKIFVTFDKPEHQEVVLEVRANVEPAVPTKSKSPERLQELEKKLDDLRKDMDNLRREMRPEQRRDP